VTLGEAAVLRSCTISNLGNADLVINSITASPAGLITWSGLPALPATLQPNASFDVTVRMAADTEGDFSETLTLRSDDPDEDPFSIDIDGTVSGPWMDFNDYSLEAYGGKGQNKAGSHAVEDDGATLDMWGNNWKALHLDSEYTITEQTTLSFTIEGIEEPEIAGIGLDTNSSFSSSDSANFFQVWGTHDWGIQSKHDYSGTDPKEYTINLGDHSQLVGRSVDYLVFAVDHDVKSPDGDVGYSNVRLEAIDRVFANNYSDIESGIEG